MNRERLSCDTCPQRELCSMSGSPYFVDGDTQCFFFFPRSNLNKALDIYYWIKSKNLDGFFGLNLRGRSFIKNDRFSGVYLARNTYVSNGIEDGTVVIKQDGKYLPVVNLFKLRKMLR